MDKNFIYWRAFSPILKKYIKRDFNRCQLKEIMQKSKNKYIEFLEGAENIGEKNPLRSNFYISLLFLSFIASNEFITKDYLRDLIEKFLNDKTIRILIGKKDFNDKKQLKKYKEKMLKVKKYSDDIRDMYPTAWQLDIDDNIHRDGVFFCFKKCSIAHFAKENNLVEEAKLMCEIDRLIIKHTNAHLFRKKTILNGDDICDFWIVPNKIKDPK